MTIFHRTKTLIIFIVSGSNFASDIPEDIVATFTIWSYVINLSVIKCNDNED